MTSRPIGYQHEIIKQYKKIKKGDMDQPYTFVTEGTWSYEKLLHPNITIDTLVYCTERLTSDFEQKLVTQLIKKATTHYVVSDKTMAKLNDKDNNSAFLTISRVKHPARPLKRIVVLDGLESPGNIGTIFRTCDGAGVDAVLIVNQKVRINQHKVIKASMGGMFNVPWMFFGDVNACQKWLHDNDFKTLLAHPVQNGIPNEKSQPENAMALVLGNERYGLSNEWFSYDHQKISIPMRGCCDSLNVAVAASILIYQNLMGPA